MSNSISKVRYALAGLLLFFCAAVQAQDISGNVKDANGEPVIGATIMEQGTQNGTVTDFDGNFTLKLQKGGDLNISYVGMKPQVVKTAGKSSVNVSLEDDNTTLNDVVVVGYGTMKRKDLTGSVSSVTGDALAKVPVANISEALQGQLGGVSVTSQDGRPGGEMSIRVRGGGSITQSNDPLFIVDGIAVSSIDDIPADQIESIDVLKDAASTAIYGARGSNGVILVTTKQAKEGKPQIKYGMYYQISAKPKMLETMSAYDHVMYNWQYAKAAGFEDGVAKYYGVGKYGDIEEYRGVASHNYMDDVFETGHMWNHDLSVSGGNDRTKYYASVNFIDNKGTSVNSGYSRWNINLKLQQKLAKTLTLDVNARYTEQKTRNNYFFSGTGDPGRSNSIVYPWMYKPIDNPLGDPTYTSGLGDGSQWAEAGYNPTDIINDNDYIKSVYRVRLISGLTWQAFKGFTAKTELSASRNWSDTKKYCGGNYGGLNNEATLTKGDGYGISWTTTANYDFADIIKNDNHALSLLVGNEVLASKSNSMAIDGYRYPEGWNMDYTFGNIQMYGDLNQSTSTNKIGVPSHTISWFGRANYNLLGRYMFTATMRADGSSKFADGNRWGYFPAGAIAWRISDEPFMKGTQDWLDNLKLRLSIGTSGNDQIDADMFTNNWTIKKDKTTGDYTATHSDIMGNPNLTWETTISRNIGIDYSFLNGKFNGSVDFYWNTTKDCLMLVPITDNPEYSYQMQNVAKTLNRGIEFAFNYNVINKKDFTLNLGLTYNYNVNKVKETSPLNLGAPVKYASTMIWPEQPYIIEVGEPVGLIRGYESAGFYGVEDFDYNESTGVWKLKDGIPDVSDTNLIGYAGSIATSYNTPDGQNAFPGMAKYADTNGDLKITKDDETVIARIKPKHTGGFHINGKWKNLDFSANFAFQFGGDVFNANLAKSMWSEGSSKGLGKGRLAEVADSWKMYNVGADGDLYLVTDPVELAELNANAKYGLTAYQSTKHVLTSDYIEDASFLRLQTLTVGYTLPRVWVNKIGITNARFYFTAGNLFCIKGYSGLDPDVNVSPTASSNYPGFPTLGYDYQTYPRSRTFTFGMSLAF